jgi:benzylsuccinate CoA-transferase BbsF subunit
VQEEALQGVHVVDFSREIAGPLTARYLAHFGATVIRVESERSPDASRTSVPPHKDNIVGLNRGPYQTKSNVNKYGMALNINHPKAIEITSRLIQWADIIAESYVPGQMAKWHLGYEDIKKIKPDIIMCSLPMQGQNGPHSKHAGLGMQLASGSGLTQILGYPDEVPMQPYGPYTDYVTPRFAASYILAALDHRRRTGKGAYIDFSQLEAALQFLSPLLLDYSVNDREVKRIGNKSPYMAPHQAYRCKGEDRWCVIAVQTDDEWNNFCKVLGNPPWTGEVKFQTLIGRKRNENELNQLIEKWTKDRDAKDVMKVMQDSGVPAGLVSKAEDLFSDPQLEYRKAFVQITHPEIGQHHTDGVNFILSETPGIIKRDGHCLGEYTATVCTELLGFSEEQFVELMSQGVFE